MARVRRFRMIALVFLVFALAGSPALWVQARASTQAIEGVAWTPEEASDGIVDSYQFTDSLGTPGVRCVNDLRMFPGTLDSTLIAATVAVMPTRDQQVIGVRSNLFQRLPNGSIALVAQSVIDSKTATGLSWVGFSDITLSDLPVGPFYLVQLEIIWFAPDELTVEGKVRRPVRFYHQTVHREGGTMLQPDDDACQSPDLPMAVVSTDRGIVNSRLTFDLYYLPMDAPMQAEWDGRGLGSFQTDDRGEVHSSFRIPAAPMGRHTIEWFTEGWSVSETFTVAPRIKVTPGSVARGQEVDVSLRGFAAREIVRIRWRNDDSWVELARVTTSGTGSANIDVTVPAWAANGANSVRGDAIASDGGRAQTNAVDVLPAGSIHLSPERGTVNSRVSATIANFPPNSPVTVTFHGYYEATASGTTDDQGQAVLTLRVPASPFGPHDVEATGSTTAIAVFDVAPRIKITPGEAAPGDAVGVSLRGFGARETVRIRWKRDGTFEQIATVTTSGSGSANLTVAVPAWTEDGATSVRGDGTIGRAQTNAFVVAGGAFAAEAEPSPTPSATATPDVTPTPTVPSPTAEPTITPEPTATLVPTEEPTISPTEEPTATPTPEATATVEPTPTETPPAENDEGEL